MKTVKLNGRFNTVKIRIVGVINLNKHNGAKSSKRTFTISDSIVDSLDCVMLPTEDLIPQNGSWLAVCEKDSKFYKAIVAALKNAAKASRERLDIRRRAFALLHRANMVAKKVTISVMTFFGRTIQEFVNPVYTYLSKCAAQAFACACAC